MPAAQSGGKPAYCSILGCSSHGDCSRFSNRVVSVKFLSLAAAIACSPKWLRKIYLGFDFLIKYAISRCEMDIVRSEYVSAHAA